MQVFFSTVVRGAPLEEAGELVALDWGTKKILNRMPIYPVYPAVSDRNTRGGGRGGRGIVLMRDEVFVASYHSLHGFDYNLNGTRTISNPNFAGLHEIKLVEDGIWTSSTALGMVQKVDFDGKTLQEWWAHDDPLVQKEFAPEPFVVDKTADNRLAYLEDFSKLHLNNVEVHNGRVYVCFNHHGAVLRLFPTEIVSRDAALKGCHNGVVTDDNELLINDSHRHTVVALDLGTGQVKRRINLIEFPIVARLAEVSEVKRVPAWVQFRNFVMRKRMTRPLFTRGLCRLDDSRILVGISPASVLELNYKTGELLDRFTLSTGANECIHGLEARPSVDFP
ncbi:MAG: hypothetical protein PCFJNLEI_03479 [Verrucomicrobiae bacterium]|nr:hypothetical protein [Verrucomicrobiae bacterium]